MALSGTVYGSVPYNSNHYTYYFTWSATQDIEKNQSTITVKHYWGKIGGNTFNSTANRDYGITIDGSTSSGSKVMDFDPWPQDPIISSYSHTVDHNPDGTKTLTISTWANGRAGSFGPSASTADADDCKASAKITLDTIPRGATLSAAPNFNDEENPTITYNSPAGNSVSSLQACIATKGSDGVWYGTEVAYRDISKTGTSYTFNLTSAERTALRKKATSNTLSVRFYVKTVIGNNSFYSSLDKTLTIKNPNPTISATVEDSNSATIALTGDKNKLVKYYSNAKYAITATAKKEATIKTYGVVCGAKTASTATGTLNAVESGSFTFTVKDSRGNTVSTTVNKTLIPYVKLTCNLAANNPTADGKMALKINGNYFNGSFGATSNTLQVQFRYKENDGAYGAWTAASPTISGNTYNATVNLTGLNYQSNYTFQARAIDKINPNGVNSDEKRVKTIPVFDWGENDFTFNVPVVFAAGYTDTAAVIDDEPIGDYVVEQGTKTVDGFVWTYRKWNSGVAECWGISSISTAVSTAWGALFASGYIAATDKTFPFTFKEVPNVNATLSGNGAGAFLIASGSGSPSTTSTGIYEIARGTSLSSGTFKINYQVKGRWK